jgi:hypothetical protein
MLLQGHVTISNDGATIMKLLDVVHPAAKTLVDVSLSQDAEVRTATRLSGRQRASGIHTAAKHNTAAAAAADAAMLMESYTAAAAAADAAMLMESYRVAQRAQARVSCTSRCSHLSNDRTDMLACVKFLCCLCRRSETARPLWSSCRGSCCALLSPSWKKGCTQG